MRIIGYDFHLSMSVHAAGAFPKTATLPRSSLAELLSSPHLIAKYSVYFLPKSSQASARARLSARPSPRKVLRFRFERKLAGKVTMTTATGNKPRPLMTKQRFYTIKYMEWHSDDAVLFPRAATDRSFFIFFLFSNCSKIHRGLPYVKLRLTTKALRHHHSSKPKKKTQRQRKEKYDVYSNFSIHFTAKEY